MCTCMFICTGVADEPETTTGGVVSVAAGTVTVSTGVLGAGLPMMRLLMACLVAAGVAAGTRIVSTGTVAAGVSLSASSSLMVSWVIAGVAAGTRTVLTGVIAAGVCLVCAGIATGASWMGVRLGTEPVTVYVAAGVARAPALQQHCSTQYMSYTLVNT